MPTSVWIYLNIQHIHSCIPGPGLSSPSGVWRGLRRKQDKQRTTWGHHFPLSDMRQPGRQEWWGPAAPTRSRGRARQQAQLGAAPVDRRCATCQESSFFLSSPLSLLRPPARELMTAVTSLSLPTSSTLFLSWVTYKNISYLPALCSHSLLFFTVKMVPKWKRWTVLREKSHANPCPHSSCTVTVTLTRNCLYWFLTGPSKVFYAKTSMCFHLLLFPVVLCWTFPFSVTVWVCAGAERSSSFTVYASQCHTVWMQSTADCSLHLRCSQPLLITNIAATKNTFCVLYSNS